MRMKEARARALRELAISGEALADDLAYEDELEVANQMRKICTKLRLQARRIDPECLWIGRTG